MFRKNFHRAFACASLAAIAAGATPASAQRIDRIAAFGDSYADDGNLFQLIGITPPAAYSTGRFSGGTNYIDTLAQILDVPVDNFAIGGALTDNRNTNSALLPGFAAEYTIFTAGGGGVFPTVSGSFDQHDLVAVSVGGNDARVYQGGSATLGVAPGTLAGAPAAAAVSAAYATHGLDVLVNAGAPTISYLAVNTAYAPEVAGDPAAQAVRNAFSTTFNTQIQQSLAGYAANGVTVHYLDGTMVLQRVAADPAAYGLTSAGPCPAANATQCVTDYNYVNQYLFYVDALHLTSAGFAILAKYVATQLAAPLTLQAPSDVGLDTARQWGRTLTTRSDLYGRGGGLGLRLFAVGDAFSRDVARSNQTSAFDVDGVGGTIGAELGVPVGLVGVAANYSRPRARFGDASARLNAHSWQIGAYGSAGLGGLFGQAYLGYGKDKNRIRRTGVIDDMGARANGHHVSAGLKGGYLMGLGVARVGPIVALDYAKAKVNGYTEAGDPALTLNVGGQSLKALTGQAGLEARADFAGISPYLDLTAEHEFSGDDRLIAYAQTSAPGIVNHWSVSRGQETYGRIAGGASADVLGNFSVNAAVSSTLGRSHSQEVSGQVGLKVNF